MRRFSIFNLLFIVIFILIIYYLWIVVVFFLFIAYFGFKYVLKKIRNESDTEK